METIKQRVFTNWNFPRFLRLGMGLWMFAWAVQSRDWSVGLFSGLFLFMAIANTGCCGVQGCSMPRSNNVAGGPSNEDI